jgi:hypothetical protein
MGMRIVDTRVNTSFRMLAPFAQRGHPPDEMANPAIVNVRISQVP